MYTYPCLRQWTTFHDNFGKSEPIFIFSLLNSERVCGGNELKPRPSNLLPHYVAKGKRSAIQLYIHVSENNMLHVRHHLFHEFLFAYCFFLFPTLTSLWHYCDIFLLHYSCLSIMKINIWHNVKQRTIGALWTSEMHDSKHVYVLKTDILNTCGKLIRVDKNSIPREPLTVIFASL